MDAIEQIVQSPPGPALPCPALLPVATVSSSNRAARWINSSILSRDRGRLLAFERKGLKKERGREKGIDGRKEGRKMRLISG